MSDDNDNRKSPLPRGIPPERFQPKVLMLWLAIILTIVVLWKVTAPATARVQVWSINQVMEAAQKGQIAKLSMKPETTSHPDFYHISGELKPGVVAQLSSGDDPGVVPPARFEARGRLTDARFNELNNASLGIEIQEMPSTTLLRDLLLGLLPFVLIIGLLYFLFVRQLRMAGKGAMSFGKSKARMLTRDRDKVTFAQVAGCDEAKVEIAEVVDFLKDPKKFQRIGGRVPKGILMVGPPGTGKTLLAKAVAGEADVPFFTISGSDFVEMFVGVGAARVRDMFEQGRKNAPCIIFIDEIDAVGRQRGAGLGGGNDEREQTLNSLLVEMDGFDPHDGVIIIAATNRPDVLDSALLRPGRFDRQITIDLPDLLGREEILKVHARKIKMVEDVDLRRVARTTPGFAGADLENLLNEAALLAARQNKKRVDMSDIEMAREKISFGTERRKLMDEEDKRMTAYHEAGHAIVQAVLKDKDYDLHKVTIIPRGRALGMTMFMPKKDILGQTRKSLLNRICMAMGGRIGEEIATGDFSNGASGDIKQATKIARHMVCDWGMSGLGPVALGENQDHIFLGKEISRSQNYSEATAREVDCAIKSIIQEQYERAQGIIAEHREALEVVAAALLEHETLDGIHVLEALEHRKIVSPVLDSVKPLPVKETEEEKSPSAEGKTEDLGPGAQPAGVPA